MGRELQKRKRRSSRPTVKQPNRLKKPLNPLGNSLIAKNWNKKETLSQNYRRLGLAAKLGKATGGVDRTSASASTAGQDPLAVTNNMGAKTGIQSVRVERDADGKIVRVLRKANPLNDPLNDLESDDDNNNNDKGDDGEEWNGVEGDDDNNNDGKETKVVDLLVAEANRPTESHKRYQSEQEREWIESLVAKHGDDVGAMARDLKLNKMQQTAADIRKRLRIYQQNLGN